MNSNAANQAFRVAEYTPKRNRMGFKEDEDA